MRGVVLRSMALSKQACRRKKTGSLHAARIQRAKREETCWRLATGRPIGSRS